MKTSNIFSFLKRKGLFLSLILFITLCLSCSRDPAHVPTPEMLEKAELMNRMVGEYEVEGRYGGEILDLRKISIQEVNSQELAVSGSGFPEFRIMNWLKSYYNPKDPVEFNISAESVGPNDGEVSFRYPEDEIMVAVNIKEGTETKKQLFLVGAKK